MSGRDHEAEASRFRDDMELYRFMDIKFENGATQRFHIKLWKGWEEHKNAIEYAARALFDRLSKYGVRPWEDLRHYNGNFATGRGKRPNRAVAIVADWIGPMNSEPPQGESDDTKKPGLQPE